jgi:hypothetical protein
MNIDTFGRASAGRFRIFRRFSGATLSLAAACALPLPAAHANPAAPVTVTPTALVTPAPAAAPGAAHAYDARATATAQLLAGIVPAPGDPLIDRLVATDAWKLHARIMHQDWVKVQERLAEMEKWRDHELVIRDAGQRTLLYPFSGPDFLNAVTLFPSHKQYVFFSLERPGSQPDLNGLSERQFVKLLENTRGAMRDIFQRNYFITDYMTKQLSTDVFKGTVPVITTMMALTGKRIVRIENVDLFPELSKQYAEPAANRPYKRLTGVRIEFTDAKTGQNQQLTYYSLDATDKALEYYPAFLKAVGANRPATAFLKSASYLLHDHQFKQTRDMLLSTADMVVQDDTGIPYRFFAQPSWQVKLYGSYAKPIRSLAYGNQPDLQAAYNGGRGKIAPVNFPFGYHWKTGQSGLMIATRQ